MTTFELEMPAIFLDGLVLEDPSDPILVFNRDPEPDETGVPIDTLISLDLWRGAAAGLAGLTSLTVKVNGVLAFTRGVGFTPDFSGPDSATSDIDTETTRIIIDPTTDFASLQLVSVEARATDSALNTFDRTWFFTIEDLTPPQLVAAIAFDPKRFRVTADEPLRHGSSSDADSALDPANWTITPKHSDARPGVPLTVVAVEQVTDAIYDLIVDVVASLNATYTIEADNITDSSGNAFVAPNNSVDCLGYQSPLLNGSRRWDIFKMFPLINRLEDDDLSLRHWTAVMQEISDLQLLSIDEFLMLADVDTAPEWMVDRMLVDLGNPFRFVLDLRHKRKLVKLLVSIYLLKGTNPGIIDTVAFFLGIPIEITPLSDTGWVLGDSEIGVDDILFPSGRALLYSFEVHVTQRLTPDERAGIAAIVNYMKPGHTHFVRLVEPLVPAAIDHVELGLSELGIEWTLH